MRRPSLRLLGVLVALVLAAGLTSCLVPESEPTDSMAGWRKVFGDEFDRSSLGRGRWTTCYWWDDDGCTNSGNNERQWYRRGNVSVDDGVLRLTARRQAVRGSDGRIYPFTSGMVTTGRSTDRLSKPPRFGFRYGRVETRMRLPEGQGLWPAMWMLPVSHRSDPEIDVVEVLGHTPRLVRSHFHFTDEDGRERNPGNGLRLPDTTATWHRYTLDWTPEQLVWYVDGRRTWTFKREQYVPDERMYLIFNLAVGGDWPGPPTAATSFPAAMVVDYVRVWKRRP
jgi:beta-glucanase (GH16 family)